MQRHDFSVDLDAPLTDVWEVFWYREPDRPQPRDVKTRIEILHPGDEVGNGLVRHCYFPVPKYLMSGGRAQSWEMVSQVEPGKFTRYDAIGKPLWSRALGWMRFDDMGDGRTNVTFHEEYEVFNPILRVLLEKRVHAFISRDNDQKVKAGIEQALAARRRASAP